MVNHNSKIGRKYIPEVGFNVQNNQDFKKLKQDPVEVIARIMKTQRSLFNKEISHWKVARAEAENPWRQNRVMLMELYHDIYVDAFIKGLVTNKRILPISNKPFKLVAEDGSENVDAGKLLQKKWMNKFIKYAMESRFFGYSLIYFWEMHGKEFTDVKLIDRRHVLPDHHKWVINQFDLPSSGFDFTAPPFNSYMIGVGETEDLGLLNNCAPLYILKKHSWANWDEFEEIFGIPMRIAKVASNDSKVRGEIERWLKDMGTAPYGIFPMDTELDLKENTRADAFEVFDRKRKACNEELEVLLTGGRSVTQDSGNYGKEKVLQEEVNEVREDDKTFITTLMNEQVLPVLVRNGYPLNGLSFTYDETEWLDPKERLQIFEGVKRLGYEVDQEQVQKDLGVEITGKSQTPQFENPWQTSSKPSYYDKKQQEEAEKGDKMDNAIRSVIELNNQYFGKK